MQIFVKTVAGSTIALEVSANDTVASLKAAIAAKDGVPACEQRLIVGGKQLEDDGRSLSEFGVQKESTVTVVLSLLGGKGKKKKKKDFKKPKKPIHRHKKEPLRVLKFYKVEGEGNDVKVTHQRMECPHPDCGAGVFMAAHKDRQTCGKCSLTYVHQKK